MFLTHLAASGFCLFFWLEAAAGTLRMPAALQTAVHDGARILLVPMTLFIGIGGVSSGPEPLVWVRLALNSLVWAAVAWLATRLIARWRSHPEDAPLTR